MKLTIEFDNDDLTDERCFLIRELFGVEKGRPPVASPAEAVAAATVVVGDSKLEGFNPPRRGRRPRATPADPVPTPEPGGIPSAGPIDLIGTPSPAQMADILAAQADMVLHGEQPLLELTPDMIDPAAIGGEELTAQPVISDRELGIVCAEAQNKYVGTERGKTIGSELRALIGEYVPAGRHYHDIAQAARPVFLEKVRAL